MASISVCHSGAINSACAGGTGSVTDFLSAGAVVSLWETWCASVACGTAAVSEDDEGTGAEIPDGTEAELTDVGTAGVGRRR